MKQRLRVTSRGVYWFWTTFFDRGQLRELWVGPSATCADAYEAAIWSRRNLLTAK